MVPVEKIVSLYPHSRNVKEALAMLENMCKQLRKHIYTAHMQWNVHVQARENLNYETFISIEDYQMNMEVMYSENPTSLAYSANKLTVAMCPICIEFKAADGTIAKGAITFLSEDKEHSHQQIQQFEHRMFEIVCEKLHRPLNHWIRYSDGCGAQFKSGYVVADMLRATENYQVKSVSFNYFEFHEGKNCSDSIGSIVKCSFTRGMLKSQQAVCNIDDILAVI